MEWFVSTGWLYLIAAIGLGTAAVLLAKWRKWGWPDRLGAFAIIVLVLHVWEEWVLPGGFHYIYNLGSSAPDRYPMSELTDMITNFGGVLLGCIVLAVWGFRTSASISVMLFSLLECVVHTFLAAQSLSAFGDLGQTVFYAPGLITAYFGWLPLFIGYVIYLVRHRPKPTLRQWAIGVVAIVIGSLLLVFGPENLLKSEDSPWSFSDHGWYEQFDPGD